VTLLYPKTENVKKENIGFSSDDGVIVRIGFVDLFRIKEFEFEHFLLSQSPETYIHD
jgi:hypothetical protein